MAREATIRFVLKCASYVLASDGVTYVLDNSLSGNRVVPLAGLPANLLALFNKAGARYITSQSMDADNITLFGENLDLATQSTPVDDLVPAGVRGANPVPVDSDGNDTFDIVVRQWDNYGIYINKTGNPVKTALIQLNGHDRFSQRDGNYFNYVQPYQHHSNTPADGVNMYSFAINPEEQ
jgi:hypothetical protein